MFISQSFWICYWSLCDVVIIVILEFSIVIHQKTQQNNKQFCQIVKDKTQRQLEENYTNLINNEPNNEQEF
jgi:hypothetical protein